MACYVDEEEVWKCPKHPSKRRRSGICPACLRHRLLALCPDCSNLRPCSCSTSSSSASSSSSSSTSFSRFFSTGDHSSGAVGRVSNLIDGEPAFRRSRSLAVPFLRSRSRFVAKEPPPAPEATAGDRKMSLWSLFKIQKNKKCEGDSAMNAVEGEFDLRRRAAVTRSRSVAERKGGGWHFRSPMKVFRQSKMVVEEGSPMYRG